MSRLLRHVLDDARAKARFCYGDDDARATLRALATDGTLAMVLYRAMQASRRRGLPLLELLFNKLNVTLGGAVIGRGAELGPRFVLVHAEGVVINGAVRGGADVVVEHQVTIGAERGKSPTLGSNIFIGAGAKLLGAITVGDGARVGANAVVLHDVPPDTTVVGIPARPVRRRARDASCEPGRGEQGT